MFDILVGQGFGVGLELVGRWVVGYDPGVGHQAGASDRDLQNLGGSFELGYGNLSECEPDFDLVLCLLLCMGVVLGLGLYLDYFGFYRMIPFGLCMSFEMA